MQQPIIDWSFGEFSPLSEDKSLMDGVHHAARAPLLNDMDTNDSASLTPVLLIEPRNAVGIIGELGIFISLAWPVVATFMCEFLPGFFSVLFVGHLHGKEGLDAAALATMYFNIFGMSLGVGMATAMDTLCSRANGAGNPLMIGVYLQRGLVLLSGLAVIVMLLNYFAADVLLLLGQDPQVVVPAMLIAVVTIGLNFLFCVVFINVLEWGYIGAAYARTLGAVGGSVLIVCYTMWGGGLSTWWAGWNGAEAWDRKGLSEWLALGVPGCIMFSLEWWAFELMAMMAGWLPDPVTSLGANMVIINVSTIVYTIYMGIGVTTTVRVANLLGEGQPDRARLVARLVTAASSCLSVGLGVVVIVFRDQIPSVFSSNRDIENAVTASLWVLAVYQLPDVVNTVGASILKGCGKQAVGAKLYVIAYYVIGLPLGYYLGVKEHHGLPGLWLGLAVGVSSCACLIMHRVFRMDWGEACRIAQEIHIAPPSSVATPPSTAAQITTGGADEERRECFLEEGEEPLLLQEEQGPMVLSNSSPRGADLRGPAANNGENCSKHLLEDIDKLDHL